MPICTYVAYIYKTTTIPPKISKRNHQACMPLPPFSLHCSLRVRPRPPQLDKLIAHRPSPSPSPLSKVSQVDLILVQAALALYVFVQGLTGGHDHCAGRPCPLCVRQRPHGWKLSSCRPPLPSVCLSRPPQLDVIIVQAALAPVC